MIYELRGYGVASALKISVYQEFAIPLGPVPDNFNSIFEWMEKNGDLTISEQEFPDGGTGERFFPAESRSFNAEKFSAKELDTLNTVANAFLKTGTKEIIAISHNESAWMENIHGGNGMISYLRYGFDLKAL